MDQQINPLVTIIVITYNSSKFVVETLESAKAQTYKNIELIISDDNSLDDTVDVCRKWIANNEGRFYSTKLITSHINTGIAPNCNRGLYAAQGDWIKIIAGDDILMDHCILTNMNTVKDSQDSFFFSQMSFFKENPILKNHFLTGVSTFSNNIYPFKYMLVKDNLAAPTSFIRRTALIDLKGFDERFPMREDYPMWIKVLKNNYKINVSKIETVIYRNNYESVSRKGQIKSENEFLSNLAFNKSKYKFERTVLISELIKHFLLIRAYDKAIDQLQFGIICLFKNEKNLFSISIYKMLFLIKPSFYYQIMGYFRN